MYFHVSIHPSSRKYLRIAFENKVYQFRVLPFGLNTAPQIFTRLGHTDRQSGPAYKYTGPSRLYPKQKEIRAGPGSGSPVSRYSLAAGLIGSFSSRVQSLGDSCSRTPSVLPQSTNLSASVSAYGVTQLGLRSYPSGSLVSETPSTSFSFIRSDRPVYATASIRSTGPCQPSRALAGITFSYLRNPYPHFSGGFHDFYGRFHSGVGRSHGGFPDFGHLDPYRPQAPHQLSGVQGGSLCPTALGSIAPGPPGYDRYGQFESSFVYQQARRDPFPHLATFDSEASPLVRGSVHNSPSKTCHNPLVAETVVVSAPTSSLCGPPPVLSLPSRSSVPAGSEVCLGLKVIPSARMEALMRHYKAAGFSDEVSRLAAAPRRPSTSGQGFDPLDPTPAQIASFLFSLFDTQGLSPQTVKGYRTSLGSVLNRTSKAKVVLHKTISDMIASMELQRPRITPVLPQWDLGIVLEALSKPPYELLREASFKHLTLKTVFLLAMASAGRRSELQVLRFDQNYIQFKPKGAGVTLYFSPEFMRKNQKPNQVNDPWYIPNWQVRVWRS